ncbi:hypothetical protein Sjap_023278 [Stephania japonica]|uniref:Uncharacterized protein n=1 Tax=Stephania japonica TaxID=461633 RepID=A0AAP0EBA8_9MAGN
MHSHGSGTSQGIYGEIMLLQPMFGTMKCYLQNLQDNMENSGIHEDPSSMLVGLAREA